MYTIDGSLGEGGGQILRSAVSVSALTSKSVRIYNIRAGRDNPGIRPQHQAAIKACAGLCDARVEGLRVGADEIVFYPRELESGRFNVDVGTAGSISLILQALLLPSNCAPDTVMFRLKGGTDVMWSPPIDYLRFVYLPLLHKFGCRANIKLMRRGFYPKGGGLVYMEVEPSHLEPIELRERGEIKYFGALSYAHESLSVNSVAERQLKAARKTLFNAGYENKTVFDKEYVSSPSVGSGILLYAVCEHSILGASSLGDRGKRSEQVGEEAASNLVVELGLNAALDSHMADQLIPFIALAGGEVSVSKVTNHCRTNIDVVRGFGFDIRLKGNSIISEGGLRSRF